MFHSVVPCFRIAELSLGDVSQLGILLQDRRAEFRSCVHCVVPCFRIAELSLGNVSKLGIVLQGRRVDFM